MLNELAKSIRFDNASKGFDPTEGGVGRYILLAISEICEGQNELRDGHDPVEIYHAGQDYTGGYHAKYELTSFPEGVKPEGFPVEIADAIIRILDIGAKFDFDFTVEATGADFASFTIDDWLVGACHFLTLANQYEPEEAGFQNYLKMALATLFLLCDHYEIKVMNVVQLKLAFNRTRPPKHGRKF